MFPTAHSTIYRNAYGEVLGWDSPSYDDGPDPDDFYDRDVPDLPCGCYGDQQKHACRSQRGQQIAGRDEADWFRWVDRVEDLAGHDLDGDQGRDGYSMDYAYIAWERGESAESYADRVCAAHAIDLTRRY